MSGVATAVVGGAVIGSVIQGQAAQNAANTEANAANAATAAQQGMFAVQQKNEQPYLNAGYDALSQIQSNMSSYNQPFTTDMFHADPGYQFTLQQGEQALQSQAAAGGHLNSSQELGNASSYAEQTANTSFNSAYQRYQDQINNSYNRLASLAGLGQTGASSINSAAQNAGNNISSNIIGAGNASAAGQIGTANAVSNGINGAAGGFMNYNLMNKLLPPSSSGSGFGAGGSNGYMDNAFSQPSMQMQQPQSSGGYTLGSLVSAQ